MIKKFLLAALLICTGPANAALEQGEVPPAYLGFNTEGDKIYLDNYQGKVVVVSFWASWCAPCLQELPVLNAFQKEAGTELMQVIAVNYKEGKRHYRKVHKVISEPLPELIFTHDDKGQIGKKYGVEGLPNLYVIGKNGKVFYHSVGFGEASIDKLITVLNDALNEEYQTEPQNNI